MSIERLEELARIMERRCVALEKLHEELLTTLTALDGRTLRAHLEGVRHVVREAPKLREAVERLAEAAGAKAAQQLETELLCETRRAEAAAARAHAEEFHRAKVRLLESLADKLPGLITPELLSAMASMGAK